MSYDSTIAADSPAGWWKLSDTVGSPTAADSSGGGRTLTATAVTFGQTGLPAGMAGDTGADFVSASSSNCAETSWDGPASPFSVEIWVNANNQSPGNFAGFICQGNPGNFSHGWVLQNDFGTIQFGVGNGSTSSLISGGSLPASGWIHVVGTYDGTTLKQYVNGAAAGTGTLTGPMVQQAGAGIQVGLENNGSFYDGQLCQAAVYSVVLTPTQVTAHYNAGITGSGVTSAGSAALAPMGMAGSVGVPGAPVTSTGSVALAPAGMSGTGTAAGGSNTSAGSVALAALGMQASAGTPLSLAAAAAVPGYMQPGYALPGDPVLPFSATGSLALAPMGMAGAQVTTACAGGLALAPMAVFGAAARPGLLPAVSVAQGSPVRVLITQLS